jgi:Ala-tRNA(Pro) deacylase
MILKKLREYLDSHNVKYVVIHHSPAFTAQEVAATAHVPGKEMIKTVMVKVDDRMTMVALPASANLDFNKLRDSLKARHVELANEREFRDLFPECEVGAMPPFGPLYEVEMVLSNKLAEDEFVAFNAGSHREVIKMAFKDYQQLTHPRMVQC